MPSNDLVQYGAMGLLAFVIAVGLGIAWRIFDRMFKQVDEYFQFVQAQAERAEERQARQTERAEQRQDGQLKAWIDAHKDQITASTTIAETMGEMLAILKRLNGKGH